MVSKGGSNHEGVTARGSEGGPRTLIERSPEKPPWPDVEIARKPRIDEESEVIDPQTPTLIIIDAYQLQDFTFISNAVRMNCSCSSRSVIPRLSARSTRSIAT